MEKKEYKELKTLVEQLAEFVAEQFVTVRNEIEEVSERKKNDILGVIDAYAKRADDQWQEYVMLTGQVKRHDRWIRRVAKDTGTKLES